MADAGYASPSIGRHRRLALMGLMGVVAVLVLVGSNLGRPPQPKTLAREALHLERLISDEVNAAYGLTPEDVKLMWATAPPRMPIPPP